MSKPTIIYDGECRFCLWSLRRIQHLDRHCRYEYVPRQAPGVDERFPILTQSDFNIGLRLILVGGSPVHVGADAVYQIYRHLPPASWIAWVYRIPGITQLFRVGYAFIARNRHRFGRVECDTGGCEISYERVAIQGESAPTSDSSGN
ncbi:MAG: DUF393 domain-containing protein [Candidatus Latescibacterota bacterium]|nr:DUF393 domain-containing protein [Candidatus Latescibacterota bacterium]